MNDKAIALPTDIKSALRARLQGMFLDLIPQAAFDKFVEDTWREFVEPQVKDGHYGGPATTYPAEITNMLRTEMRTQLQAKVQEWATAWRKGPEGDAAARQVLENCTKIAAASFIESVSRGIVDNALTYAVSANMMQCNCGAVAVRNTTCTRCNSWNS